MYTVNDAMTQEPITVGPDDGLDRASMLMKQGRLRHLPVVHHGKLVGLLSERDLLAAASHRPTGPGPARRVRDAMVTAVHTATLRMPLRRAARIMYDEKYGCLPVVDDERHVVGILTETDFIRFAADIAVELDRAEAVATRVSR